MPALGVPHYVLNLESAFGRDVVDDFVDEYARGRTPIPCVRCNTFTKFRDLVAKADAIDARWIATGHYARVVDGELHRGTRSREGPVVLPLGHRPRGAVADAAARRIADQGRDARRRASLGLEVVAEKTESQDICFVPDGDHTKIIRSRLGDDAPSLSPGPFVLSNGDVVGMHDGFARFTIGQRRGLPGGFREPMFVVAIRPDDRAVVIGPREELLGRGVIARDVNWLVDAPDVGARVQIAGAPSRRAGAAPRSCVSTPTRSSSRSTSRCRRSRPDSRSCSTTATRVLGGGFIEAIGAALPPMTRGVAARGKRRGSRPPRPLSSVLQAARLRRSPSSPSPALR